MPKLLHVNTGMDITKLASKITWSGSRLDVPRKLEVSLASSPTDFFLPRVDIPCGHLLKLVDDSGAELTSGFVFGRQKSYSGTEIILTAYDGMKYLIKNKWTRQIRNTTAENLTAMICSEYGIPVGSLASTGIPMSRIFEGDLLYDSIMTFYAAAGKQNGKQYKAMMIQGKLSVVEYGLEVSGVLLEHLKDSRYSDSIEAAVTGVQIYDENQRLIGLVENAADRQQYGRMQETYTREKGVDPQTAAKALLKGIEQKGGIDVPGDVRCISSRSVHLKEHYTGLVGRFWIESDVHTWEKGQHSMTLELALTAVMDAKTAGKEIGR